MQKQLRNQLINHFFVLSSSYSSEEMTRELNSCLWCKKDSGVQWRTGGLILTLKNEEEAGAMQMFALLRIFFISSCRFSEHFCFFTQTLLICKLSPWNASTSTFASNLDWLEISELFRVWQVKWRGSDQNLQGSRRVIYVNLKQAYCKKKFWLHIFNQTLPTNAYWAYIINFNWKVFLNRFNASKKFLIKLNYN